MKVTMKDKISVMVQTHIVHATTEPYINNEMLVRTIQSSHDKLGLEDAKYYIYIDKAMEVSYPDLFKDYYDAIKSQISNELSHINVDIVEDRQHLMRGSWWHMIDNCDTPYFLFLEHDWEFVEKIPTIDIIDKMDKYEHFNYLRFPYTYMGPGGPSHWDSHDGGYPISREEEIDLPMTKCIFYSANPHIVSTERCKEFYKPIHQQYWSDRTKGTRELEKELADIIKSDVAEIGGEETHKKWGSFIYGVWGDPNHIPPVKHLGDWCRKG